MLPGLVAAALTGTLALWGRRVPDRVGSSPRGLFLERGRPPGDAAARPTLLRPTGRSDRWLGAELRGASGPGRGRRYYVDLEAPPARPRDPER